jgi:hypothetical protein
MEPLAPSAVASTVTTTEPYSASDWITPTFLDGLRIWWAYYWPTFLIGSTASYALTYTLLKVYGATILSPSTSVWILRIIPIILTAVTGLFVFQYLLRTQFRRFRIAIFPASSSTDQVSIPTTTEHGLRVWFAFTWRSIVYGLIAGLVASVPLGFITGMLTYGPVSGLIVQLVVSFVVNGGVGLFVIYSSILDEDFGSFSVRLVPH